MATVSTPKLGTGPLVITLEGGSSVSNDVNWARTIGDYCFIDIRLHIHFPFSGKQIYSLYRVESIKNLKNISKQVVFVLKTLSILICP